MSPAIYIAPDADLTERQQRVFELLCLRETGEFKTINQLSAELGDKSSQGIYQTIRRLARKGLVEETDAPLGWRVKWIHRPTTYVRQGRREGWMGQESIVVAEVANVVCA